jgi:hypothetical protein
MSHHPSPELVAVAWAKTVGGDVDPTKVATTLPGDATTWATSGFVVATVMTGNADRDLPWFEPVVSFDCWTAAPNSNKAPWGQASAMAAALQWATYRRTFPALTMPAEFYPVRLLGVSAVNGPTRVPGDEAGFARVRLDVALSWTVTAAVPA